MLPCQRKILCIDTETTGLSPEKNSLTEIAIVLYIENKPVSNFWSYVQPIEGRYIDNNALAIQGLNRSMLASFPSPQAVYNDLINWLDNYIDPRDKQDKACLLGHNVRFDMTFLVDFVNSLRPIGSKFPVWGCYTNWITFDTLSMAYLATCEAFQPENYKLDTLCEGFGISLDAHQAINDVEATIKLVKKLAPMLNITRFDALEPFTQEKLR